MSAYGSSSIAPPAPRRAVGPRLYAHPTDKACLVLALPFSKANPPPHEARRALKTCFDNELALGKTYPQRGPLSDAEFDAYFLSYDLILGLLLPSASSFSSEGEGEGATTLPYQGQATSLDSLSLSLADIDWSTRLAFGYYIKPNYPGRSSHLCNAGFLIPPSMRGQRLGSLAGRSYIHYAPLLGFKGSVFNLVYVSNVASTRIWDALGFERVGRIPHAGLLVVDAAGKEEYTDAWLIHGDFEKLQKRLDEASH